MSSDYEFDDFPSLNDVAISQIDAIETAALAPTTTTTKSSPEPEEDFTFGEFDPNELDRIDDFIQASYNGAAQPVAGPSRMHQTTLFGDVLPLDETTRPVARTPFGRQSSKTKKWDQTKFLATGQKKRPTKKKQGYDSEEEVETVEFEQYPAPFITRTCFPSDTYCLLLTHDMSSWVRPLLSVECATESYRPPPPMKLKPDLLEAKHWVYPLNREKRSYQFNIVKHCLFENTIVALPTGLGKTFIAGVVMLNYYRWFPKGKVVFAAPTKPLVSQQIEACHETCGIPGSDAIELTGNNPVAMRARAWKEKRIFYMTPQTFFNDLEKGTCDARDVVLIVIDEAHRAQGDYAYTKIVQYMMAKNPYFRVLALSATPGSTPEVVQGLVDNLHISRIEIRNDDSLDIQPYIHEKRIERHIIKMSEEINKIKDPLIKLMNTYITTLRSQGIPSDGPPFNALSMHPHRPQATIQSLHGGQKFAAMSALMSLSRLARAVMYLTQGTIGMCSTYLQTLASNPPDEDGKRNNAVKNLIEKPMFKAAIKELETLRLTGVLIHPKMEVLKRILIDHFGKNLGDGEAEPASTKAMVFLSFREGVEEVVKFLNEDHPLLRAQPFIGQGKDKNGVKGLTQKEQLEASILYTKPHPINNAVVQVIRKFKADEFNILVATSIGEEGLDIGEVDLIICYENQSTPIRVLQRFGRTGRKRDGVVHVLLSEGREEVTIDKAMDKQKLVHGAIVHGEQLELYGDVERLLPDHIRPECLEKEMEIERYVRDDKKRTSSKETSSNSKGTKRKRNDDPARNIPTGANMGFTTASKLRVKEPKPVKEPKRQKVEDTRSLEERGEDDDMDRELEEGIVGLRHRAMTADSLATTTKSINTTTLRRAATEGTKRATTKKAPPKTAKNPSSTDIGWLLDEDDDDVEVVEPVKTLSAKAAGKQRASTPVKNDMPPPPVPSRAFSPPQPSFPVRRGGKQRVQIIDIKSSPQVDSSPVQRRLHRRGARVDKPTVRSEKKRPPRGLYDLEAVHSGDEESEGGSEEEDPESESDRQFLKDFPDTQVSPSYDQSLVYRQSLLTQAPGRGPIFAGRPVRNGLFGRLGGEKRERATVVSSSPYRGESESDEYAFGSFVVADDSCSEGETTKR
ncbi:hypothetical protein MIND_00462500 [Mycena indigotica]|uniref:ATP-dependent DNA helicase n=1 Tax=Mycena indigotica TaxID=2126181 RepID=A0A8H6W9K3_9AGAR|nr:uncharacterized protein MIND_00462500 [Mycena indigotica]KAF7306708.1 hypothetical protein MIND_00462500 [Mycena indigotica]